MNHVSKRFLASLVIVPLAFLIVACSGDDDDASNGNNGGATQVRDTSVEPRDEYAEYCDTVEEMLNSDATPLESGQAQLEVAPDDLREDIQRMVTWVELRDSDDPDPEAVNAAAAEGQPAALRVFATLRAECGITVPLN